MFFNSVSYILTYLYKFGLYGVYFLTLQTYCFFKNSIIKYTCLMYYKVLRYLITHTINKPFGFICGIILFSKFTFTYLKIVRYPQTSYANYGTHYSVYWGSLRNLNMLLSRGGYYSTKILNTPSLGGMSYYTIDFWLVKSLHLNYNQNHLAWDRWLSKPNCMFLLDQSKYYLLVIRILGYIKYICSNIIVYRLVGIGYFFITYTLCIMFLDACLTDDEPLWEPIEWSLVQTWILFIFMFAWIAENLIVSRYGSYTGRDKRVWMGWYKTFWLMEFYYLLNFGAVIILIIVPFYYELNYNLAFLYSWWHWYSRVFFFKFIFIFSLILILTFLLQLSLRWCIWKKNLIIIIVVNIFISYLLYIHFILTFFGYFTDPIWYQKVRPIDYIQMSHEPFKWGWGGIRKDHFSYHNVKTVFWFKNDGPYASSFLIIELYLFLSLFFLYIYWVVLFRRVISVSETPYTLLTYCVSALKQFFFFFLMLYVFIFFSFISHYLRLPFEYLWEVNNSTWFWNFILIIQDYSVFVSRVINFEKF